MIEEGLQRLIFYQVNFTKVGMALRICLVTELVNSRPPWKALRVLSSNIPDKKGRFLTKKINSLNFKNVNQVICQAATNRLSNQAFGITWLMGIFCGILQRSENGRMLPDVLLEESQSLFSLSAYIVLIVLNLVKRSCIWSLMVIKSGTILPSFLVLTLKKLESF